MSVTDFRPQLNLRPQIEISFLFNKWFTHAYQGSTDLPVGLWTKIGAFGASALLCVHLKPKFLMETAIVGSEKN